MSRKRDEAKAALRKTMGHKFVEIVKEPDEVIVEGVESIRAKKQQQENARSELKQTQDILIKQRRYGNLNQKQEDEERL
jgi:ribosomal protein L24